MASVVSEEYDSVLQVGGDSNGGQHGVGDVDCLGRDRGGAAQRLNEVLRMTILSACVVDLFHLKGDEGSERKRRRSD